MAKRRSRRRTRVRRYARRIKSYRPSKPKILSLLHLIPTVKAVTGIPHHGVGGAWQFASGSGAQAGLTEFVDVMTIQYTGYKPSEGKFIGWDMPKETYLTHAGVWIINKALSRFVPSNIRKKLTFGGWNLV